jgi:hypothetical protein
MSEVRNPINVTTCMGCKKGIESFVLMENQFFHLDLFATPGEGHQFKCNSENIGDILIKSDNGVFFPDTEHEVLFREQSFWWTEILTLAMDVFGSDEAILEFLNTGESGKKMWNNTNDVIEKELISIAENKGIVIDATTYPDLLLWNN